jgi:hypothetical protein
MQPDETMLWRIPIAHGDRTCVMISCCSGAELQVREGDAIVLRELYPDKPTLYERAAQLRDELSVSEPTARAAAPRPSSL